MTSAFGNANGVIDKYTKEDRGEQVYSKFKEGYLQGLTSSNFSEIQLSVLSKVLDESLNQNLDINLTLQTEGGLKPISRRYR
jgi:hypothetical protein